MTPLRRSARLAGQAPEMSMPAVRRTSRARPDSKRKGKKTDQSPASSASCSLVYPCFLALCLIILSSGLLYYSSVPSSSILPSKPVETPSTVLALYRPPQIFRSTTDLPELPLVREDSLAVYAVTPYTPISMLPASEPLDLTETAPVDRGVTIAYHDVSAHSGCEADDTLGCSTQDSYAAAVVVFTSGNDKCCTQIRASVQMCSNPHASPFGTGSVPRRVLSDTPKLSLLQAILLVAVILILVAEILKQRKLQYLAELKIDIMTAEMSHLRSKMRAQVDRVAESESSCKASKALQEETMIALSDARFKANMFVKESLAKHLQLAEANAQLKTMQQERDELVGKFKQDWGAISMKNDAMKLNIANLEKSLLEAKTETLWWKDDCIQSWGHPIQTNAEISGLDTLKSILRQPIRIKDGSEKETPKAAKGCFDSPVLKRKKLEAS